jgi:hypothetical protein
VDKSGLIPAATLHTRSMLVIIETSYDLLAGLSKVVIDLLVRLFKAGVSLSQNIRKSLHSLEETYKLIASYSGSDLFSVANLKSQFRPQTKKGNTP